MKKDSPFPPFAFLTADENAVIENKLVHRKIIKGDVLLAAGETCRSIFFLQSGAVYQYLTQDVNELIIDLHTAGDWVLNHSSFVSQKPSLYGIKSYTDSDIHELSLYSLHSLIKGSPNFLSLGRILDQARERTHFFDSALSPADKYQYIMERRPALLQHFPLKMIASYLKVTPETLSRVRGQK